MACKNKLSIYLLRKGLCKKEDIFSKSVCVLKSYSDNSIVYYQPSEIHEPSWLKNFFLEKNKDDLLQTSSKVVLIKQLIIDGEERTFALTFGFAKSLFKEDVLEEQFGLKIVLNTIEQNQIRRISKSSIGSNQKQSDEQMPKSSDISEFGFDINRDLMKNVSGKSSEIMFDKSMITGGDIFSLTVGRNINNIDELLSFCYTRYKEETYKKKFSWIDNIKKVKDKAKIEQLNKKLMSEIKEGNYDSVWMAVPEVIEWDKIKNFKISGDDEVYDDIYIEKVIASLRNELKDINQLKNKNIYACSSSDDEKVYKWTAFKCIVAEIGIEEQEYCLSNGNWYNVNPSFVEIINESYNAIRLSEEEFIDYTGGFEDHYNESLTAALTNAKLMHTCKIAIGGGQGNNIEPCDVFWNKKLIHIKINGGSSALSHLFNQALVAGQMWMDSNVREQIRDKMKAQGKEVDIPEPFRPFDYEIVIAIINKFSDERPKIPFFSKVSLNFVAANIKNLGYELKLKNIKMVSNVIMEEKT